MATFRPASPLMTPRSLIRSALFAALALIVLGIAGFGGWLLTLPPGAEARRIDPATATTLTQEYRAMLAALKPPKRQRPLVAIIGSNEGTEITDFLTPTGVLRRADVADVVTVATRPGPLRLYPTLTVEADETTASFDAGHPDGADYVIVPAMQRDDDPLVLDWLRAQASRGALIVGVCAGAKVVGAAGLLDGRRATTHWYFREELLSRSPTITWVPDRRFLIDHGIVTTTGITASMPMMLTLVEAIAGEDRALALARDLGLARWDAWHDSGAFGLTRPFATTVLANRLAFWRHERLAVELTEGVDEVALALVLDAWSRTYRSQAVALAPAPAPASESASALATQVIRSRHGVRILAVQEGTAAAGGTSVTGRPPATDAADSSARLGDPLLADAIASRPAEALEQTLRAIAGRYGEGSAAIVATQLEYPWQRARP